MPGSDLISATDLFSYANITPPASWQANHTYALGNVIVDPAGHNQKCTTPGLSGATIPTFNDAGGTITEGPTTPPLAWADQGNSISTIAEEIIGGWSQAVYWMCGRSAPMLTEETEFSETYNGSGSDVLYVMNAPILSVSSLTVNGRSFPASAAFGQAGYFIQQDGKSIALRSGACAGYPFPSGYGGSGYRFAPGRGNVAITYTAGYDGCPPDLYLLSLKQCTVFLNKRLREDAASQLIPSAGQMNYRQKVVEIKEMLQPYIRTAMTNIFV